MSLKLPLTFFACFSATLHACTIFVLTDANRALFCNNEDWINPKTRIWFVPATPGHYGCAFVGFDDDLVQGGVNTEGLALDVVAGYQEKWESDRNAPIFWLIPNRWVLENCATVEGAIAYFRSHRYPGLASTKMLISDRTGASVVIGAKDNELQVEKSTQCQGIGYGHAVLAQELPKSPEPTVANGFRILRASLQKGWTRYSNIFDLKTGDIYLRPFQDRDDQFHLNLADELKKGGHYYDMPQLAGQLLQEPRPLLDGMKRSRLDEFKPIPDQPEVTAHLRAVIQDAIAGTSHPDDYPKEFWPMVASGQKDTQALLKKFGDFVSLTLVERSEANGRTKYRYLLEFQKSTLLQMLVFDSENKLVESVIEDGKEHSTSDPAGG